MWSYQATKRHKTTWASWRRNPPATRLFVQRFVQANNKEGSTSNILLSNLSRLLYLYQDASFTKWFFFQFIVCNMSTLVVERVYSSPPSAAHMRHWIGSALVQIMACRLFDPKPWSKPMLTYCQFNPYEQTLVIFFCQNTKLFIHENASQKNKYVACDMVAILPRLPKS